MDKVAKKILLTGIGGSIGCHILAHLLEETDWSILGIDSFRHKGLRNRVDVVLKVYPEQAHRVHVLQHDLTQPIPARELGPVDYVIAMASLSDVHDSILDPVPFIYNNVRLILNTLEYVREAKPKTFLLVSTDEVYGPTDGKTLHPEWSAILPSNPYSSSKVCQESCAISFWRSYSLPLIIVNLMNNFGEMQSSSKFPAIIQRKVRSGEVVQIHANGDQIGSRCYLHSRNTADAILFLLRTVLPYLHQDGSIDRPDRFNIVGDVQVSNLDLAKLIAGYIGNPLSYELVASSKSRPGHDIHYGLDGSKLASLGWKPPYSFEESMQRTVAWYEEHPEWLKVEGP